MLATARARADDRDLVALLRRVACAPAGRARATGAPRPRAGRASTRRRIAARTPRAAARWRAPCQRVASARLSSIDARVCSSRRAGTAGSASIMHLPIDGAQARRLERLEHGVGVVHRLHRQRRWWCRSAAARTRPGGAEAASDAGRVRGLHRPDARLQPIEQRQVVGVAAEQRLAQVDVGLDEAGEQVVPRARRSRGRARTVGSTAPTDTIRPSRRARRPRRCRRRRSW